MLRNRKKLRIFYNLTQSSSRSPALYDILKELTQHMAEVLRAEIAVVFLYNEETNTLDAQRPCLGLDHLSTMNLRLPLDDTGLLADVFRKGKPALVTRRPSQGLDMKNLLPGHNVFDLISCPLVARGKNIGSMVLANKLTRRGFTLKDLELAEMLAPHISIFIENALLYRRSEEKVAQLTSLIRVVDAINTVSNLDQLYNLALDVIRGLFAVEKAHISMIDKRGGMLETVRSFGCGQEYIERHLSKDLERVTHDCYVMKHDSTFLCSGMVGDDRCANMVVDEETKSVLCVPIRSREKIYGILHMASRHTNAFDDEDAVLANAIGEQVGMAVESAKLFEEVNRLAITDGLTGIFNIRHLQRVLGEEVKRSIRYKRPLSFIMLDIDYFKVYNDLHGHLRGDEVLRMLGDLLQKNTRDVDTVFRYGGEEFSVIIPEVDKQEAFSMADRIRRVVQDHPFPYEKDQPEGNLTISAGVANLPDDATDGGELIDKADRALYRAKQMGRNKICLYSPEYDTIAQHVSSHPAAGRPLATNAPDEDSLEYTSGDDTRSDTG